MTSVVKRILPRGPGAALLLAALGLVTACESERGLHTLSGSTMGTTWSVKVAELPPGVSDTQLHSDIRLLLESVNNQMSTWAEDSVISRFNRAQADTRHTLPPDFYQVLDYALEVARDTEGAYDPTVGPLVDLWGFGSEEQAFRKPEEQALERVRERTGWDRLELNAEQRSVVQPGGAELDLSSVAKGYAVDKVARFLRERGVEAFLVEIGGELRARGAKPGGEPWRVAVEKPQSGPQRVVEEVVRLRDRSMATSGDYRNFHEEDGEIYSHTIDPRTGRPVEHRLASVTVLAANCMKADAWATALNVLGPDEGLELARERNLAVFMMERTDDGLRKTATASFEKYREER